MADTLLNKLLFVEDEPDIRTIAKIALEDLGQFSVIYCESGFDAIAAAEANPPDLILLDVMMPGMDGISTFKALKSKSVTVNIPVIFMTAKVQSFEIDQYIKLGASGVIAKPFDPMTLADQIRSIWKSKIIEV